MALRFLGTVVTDSNGNAVLSDGYTGTGAGRVDLLASIEDLSNVSISVNPSTIDDSDSTTVYSLSATVSRGGSAVVGESVSFELRKQVDGSLVETLTGITNSSGVATVSYSGKHTGQLYIKAICEDMVSQPYTVVDCIKWDTGIDGTATNIYLENITSTVTRGSEYSTLKEPASSNVTARISVPMQDMNIEIDIAQVDGTLTNACFVFADSNYQNSSNFSISHTNVSLGEFVHLTIEIRSGIATVKNNKNSNTVTKDLTAITTTNLYTGLWTSSDITELRFKDFKVYPV